MPGLFDDVLNAPRADAPVPEPASPPPGSKGGGLFDDVLNAPRADAAGAGKAPALRGALQDGDGLASDVVDQAGAGLIRGAAGLADLPQTLYGLADRGISAATSRIGGTARRALGYPDLAPEELAARQAAVKGALPSPADLPRPGENAVAALESVAGKLPEPRTTTGAFVRTAAEFVPGAGRRVADVVVRGVLPGLASESAGQAMKGSALEPWARVGAGLGAGAAGAIVRAPGAAERAIGQRAESATAAQVDQAEALFQDAASRGLPLTRANALDAVTNGVTSLSDLQRVIEGNGRLRGFFAPTAAGVAREGRSVLDTIAPAGATPTALGGQVQDAARAAVAQTPEGRALAQAREAAGPRVTAEQAGQAIQPELRRVYEGREGMRAALAEQDYRAAERAPESIGIEGRVAVERPGELIVTETQPRFSRPQFTAEAPRPPDPVEPGRTGPAPEGFTRYLATNGGIPLDAEARAADLHRTYVPGGGTLARNNGRSWDDWRVKLVEDGWMPYREGHEISAADVADRMRDLIQRERVSGARQVRIGDEGAQQAARDAGANRAEYADALALNGSRLDEALRGAGIDAASVHGDIRARATGAMTRDERLDPLDAYEQVVGGLREPPRPYVKTTPTTITEEIPDVRYGQVNPQGVVDHIDTVMRSAKGPVLSALQHARRMLFEQDGRTLDLSVAGLDGARKAINDLIGKAEPQAQSALMGVRDRLDRALGTVPEYEHARAGFENASRNLDPFAPGTAPGRVVNRDQVTGRMTMPPERVPEAIAEGPNAARQFNEVAPPDARAQMSGRLATQTLDAAMDAAGDVSAAKIHEALRRDEDLFAQFPEARASLEQVAFAREGREAVDRSPLGQIAKRPDAAAAIEALFPTQPKVTNRAPEVAQAVRGLAENSPRAAQDLVRMHLEAVLNEALRPFQSGANQAAGPRFSRALTGNPEQAATLEAAMRALPGGEQTWAGVRRLLDIFDAQGQRQTVGGQASFNDAIMTDLGKGTPLGEAGAAAMTGGLKLPQRIMDRIEGWRLGRGLDEMARLLTDPKMAGTFRRLATEPQGSAGTVRLVSMVMDRALRGYGAAQRVEEGGGPKREPLRFIVRPRT